MMNDHQLNLSPRLLDELEELRAIRTDEEISYFQGCGFRSPRSEQPVSTPESSAKKRGRRGKKLIRFFFSISPSPQPARDLCRQYGVSENTIRQARRFDRYPDKGRVKTRTVGGVLMIWRQIGNDGFFGTPKEEQAA